MKDILFYYALNKINYLPIRHIDDFEFYVIDMEKYMFIQGRRQYG